MQGKQGTGDPGGPNAKSGRYSSGSGLCPSGEKSFFADAGLASVRSARPWVDRPSEVRPSSPLHAGMDKVQWQTQKHGYWMELTEPTLANLLAAIDRILSCGFGYRMLIGTTGQDRGLLRADPEKPLPLAEIIRITNSRHVRIWWSVNPPSKPMDLPFCAHHSTNTKDSTPAPGDLWFDPHDNRGTPSDEEWPSRDEELNFDGHPPESSTAAAKRTTSSRTTRSANTTKKTGRTHSIH